MQEQAPPATPDQLARLNEVLARPEFQVATGNSMLQQYLDAIRAWFWSWVVWLLDPLLELLRRDSDTIAPILVYGLIGVSAVIVIAGLVLIRRLSRGSVAGDGALADFSETGRPRAADELGRSRDAAAGGDPRQAIHHLYLAILLRLDEREHLAFDGALTNRELLPRLTAAPALAEPFEALVSQFDRLWYGQQTCTVAEYEAFHTLADTVWQAAGTVSPIRASERPSSGTGAPLTATSVAP